MQVTEFIWDIEIYEELNIASLPKGKDQLSILNLVREPGINSNNEALAAEGSECNGN